MAGLLPRTGSKENAGLIYSTGGLDLSTLYLPTPPRPTEARGVETK